MQDPEEEGRALRNIGNKKYIFPTVKSALPLFYDISRDIKMPRTVRMVGLWCNFERSQEDIQLGSTKTH